MNKASCTKEGHKYTWSRESTKILIELYEGFPCLYQVTIDDYHNKNKRTAAFEAITREFNKRNFTHLTPKTIQEKIHGVRSQYLAGLNKIKKSKVSGAGTDEIHKPKLWCFELLHFISKGAPVTKGESNMETHQSTFKESYGEESMTGAEIVFEGDIEEVDNLIMSPVQSSGTVTDADDYEHEQSSRSTSRLSEHTPARKRKRSSEKADKLEKLMESAAQTLKYVSSETPELNSNVCFSQFIAAELNSIQDDDILDDIKQQILNVILNGKKIYRQRKNQ